MAETGLDELYETFEGMATRAEVEAAWRRTSGPTSARVGKCIDILSGMEGSPISDDEGPRPARLVGHAPKAGRPPPPPHVPQAGPSKLAAARPKQKSRQDVISISSSDEDDDVAFVYRSKVAGKGKKTAARVPTKSAIKKAPLEQRPQPARPSPPRLAPPSAQAARSPRPHLDSHDAVSSPAGGARPPTAPQSDASSVPLPPSPPPESSDTPQTTAINQLLILLSDIDPVYASTVVSGLIAKGHQQCDQIVDLAMEEIFAHPKGYPKLDKKRKRDGDDDVETTSPSKKAKGKMSSIDYLSENRNGSGEDYLKLSFESLYEEFAYVPLDFIKKTFFKTALYVPAYFALKQAAEMDPKPYKVKQVPYKSKGKARAKFNAEWDAERNWLLDKLRLETELKDVKLAEELRQKEVEENGEGIECGCCYGTAPFEKCVQCNDGHLFCSDCIVMHANNELGSQKTDILCMDTDGCKAPFPESELARTLPQKTMNLLQRLLQQKHIKESGLELDSCPFCDFSICIENPDEKLFVCQNEECAVVSCRKCKRVEHLPRSCEEMNKDDKLDLRHLVEEEMSKALIRNCPNATCKKPAIKEAGCNKMSCSVCRTLFCYVCNAIIKDYSHFDQQPDAYHKTKDGKKCPLWEDMDARHAKEVKEARERAKATLRARGEDIADEDIDVELPEAAPALAPGAIAAGLPYAGRVNIPAVGIPPPNLPAMAAAQAALLAPPPWDPDGYARLIQAGDYEGARGLVLGRGYVPPAPIPRPLPRPPPAPVPRRPVAKAKVKAKKK